MNPEQRIKTIQDQLQALSPTRLEIIDQSQFHVGHAGASGGAGHFKLVISSPQFTSLSPVACHRLIYRALGHLMDQEIHALSIEIA